MGEDEAHWGFLWISVKQELLILHDQVIGIYVIRCLLLSVIKLAVRHPALLINREVTCVGLVCWYRLKVFQIFPIIYFNLHIAYDILIFLLEHIRKDAIKWRSCFIILLVVIHFINEEQREYLYPPMEKLTLFFNVGQYRFPNLQPADLFFAYLAYDITRIYLDSIDKFDGIVPSINEFNGISILILCKLP